MLTHQGTARHRHTRRHASLDSGPSPDLCSCPRTAGAAARRSLLAWGCTEKGPNTAPTALPGNAALQAAAFDAVTCTLLWSTPIGDRELATWGDTGALTAFAHPLIVNGFSPLYAFSGEGRANPPIEGRGSTSTAADDTRVYSISSHYVKKSVRDSS
ncbi:hypothetical protein GCM10010371_64000 [Streptomyces subrutilus]|uniref:Uncharacterized protein n=1 Tax=Streptomyces subrutilus TaxID=36818 RepID=A0A918VGJ7_9ACTN|nr:hypothetical protein GCM10010371_64000 [Streptomyces subrutilus]